MSQQQLNFGWKKLDFTFPGADMAAIGGQLLQFESRPLPLAVIS